MRISLLFVALFATGVASANEPSQWMAREGRVSFLFNFDYGFVSMDGFEDYADSINLAAESLGADASAYEALSGVLGTELGVRYYAPYHIVAQFGVGAVLGKAEYKLTAPLGSAKVEYWNLTLELPILLGGHYAVHDRIHLHGAVGPVVLMFPGSYWDSTSGLPDFEGKTGIGFQARFGAEFYALDALSFGLELVYRHEKADVTEKNGGKVILANGKVVDGYELDFSGIGFKLGFRLVL